MRLTLVNARIPGERGLIGSGINVVIEDGIIADIEYVGQTASFSIPSADAVRDEQIIDLKGRFVMPGLWDAHVHVDQWALTRTRLDMTRAESADHAAQIVGEQLMLRAANKDAGRAEPIIGFGWRGTLWDDEPHKDLLDRYTGSTPVYLFSVDLHTVWLNSAALAVRGVEHATGLLIEQDCYEIERDVSITDDETLDALVLDASRHAASLGVVGIVDLELAWNASSWRRRIGAGNELLRVEAGIYPEHLDRAIEAGMRTGDTVASTNGLVRVGRLKMISDGSLGSRTAFCSHAYPGVAGRLARGVLNYSPESLKALVGKAQTHGLECSIHAIGDDAVALALDVFEATDAAGAIEHAQLVRPDDVERMAVLEVIASVQPEHAMDDRDAVDELWGSMANRAFPFADLLDAGVQMQFGSDAPVTDLNPWHAIAAAVSRSRDGRSSWRPEQCIDVESALEASCRSRLAIGQPADLMALDVDPLECDPKDLRTMTSALTLVAGRVTHSSLKT